MAASARASMRLLSRQLALARLSARAYASRVGTHSYVAAGSVRAARSLGSVTSIPQRAIHTTSALLVQVFKMPDIGEGIYDVTIRKWFVKPGDKVKEFDMICEVSSDKANVEIKSICDGTIMKLYHGENETAIVGKPLFDIDPTGGAAPSPAASSPVTPSTPAPASSTTTAPDTQANVTESNGKYLMTPAVRRIVAEHNVDLRKVVPTGKDGRVLKEDVLRFLDGTAVATPAPASTASSPSPSPSAPSRASAPPTPTPTATPVSVPPPPAPAAADQVVVIRGVQKAMVKSMTAALKVPTFGYSDEVTLDKLVEVRKQLLSVAAKSNIKLSFMPFFLKAASLALLEYPTLNAHVNDECTEMILRADHNISVAMDTPSGLLVPNIKGVQRLSILEIAAELNRLQALGAAGRLGPAELNGGTFAISNIGVVGGTYLRPVVVVPQVCIGAFGRSRKLPRFDESDNVVANTIMEVSWSADHRVIDGMTMAKYSNRWKSFVEEPASMLLHLK